LAFLLLPKLQETAMRYNTTPRLTVVSSHLHKFATFQARKANKIFEDYRQEISDWDNRYHDSKLLVVLLMARFAQEVNKASKGRSSVSLTSMAPGYCLSSLRPPRDFAQKMAERVLARPTEEGGYLLVDAVALDKAAGRHGHYINEAAVGR
jgi:retinol dehydrogenase 12